MTEFASAAIANTLVDIAGRSLTQMKLHKLTYMAHGWHLAITGEPLVTDKPEAWDNGPVFRLIWDRIRDYGLDNRGRILKRNRRPFEAEDISEQEMNVLRHVWRKYGRYSAYKLSNMTHQPGTPWTQTYFDDGRDAVIPDDLIRHHYRELALAGRVSA